MAEAGKADGIVFLEHKADVLYEASGASFEKALERSALGLFETIADTRRIAGERSVSVQASAKTLDEIVFLTLSSLLSESEANELFLKKFVVNKFGESADGYSLEGTAFGSRADARVGRTVVKAVTLHELRVEKRGEAWTIRVLLDV